jgi:hypothetical protein
MEIRFKEEMKTTKERWFHRLKSGPLETVSFCLLNRTPGRAHTLHSGAGPGPES